MVQPSRLLPRIGIALAGLSFLASAPPTLADGNASVPDPPTASASRRCHTFVISRDDDYFWGMSYGFTARNTGCVTARRVLRRADDRLFVSRDVPQSAYGNYDANLVSQYGTPFAAGRFTCRYTRLGSDIGKGYCRRGSRKITWHGHVLKG